MGGMSDLSAANLESGSLVGGYTLISRLGSGAMGSVWRVRDDGGHQYAMKILRDSLSDDDDSAQRQRDQLTARERLRREAMALRKVRHPGVCGIVDMELDDALAFIVTELIEGKNLREDVRINGRYVGDDLERLARKLIEAVRAVHAAGIVHRDIKPTNVMVSNTGPVLVDFGIAMGEGESHVTRTGLVMGTPGFIAPEIIDGAESDEKTDWWSVASVLAFAATGKPVFGTKPMMTVLERAAAGSADLAGLPAGTMAAFRAALNPDRTKRCSPEDLLQAIAVDALNPQSWATAGNGDETEAMPPFAESPDNPRILWRLQDDTADEGAVGTRPLPQPGETTQVIDLPGMDATQVIAPIGEAEDDAGTSGEGGNWAGDEDNDSIGDETEILPPDERIGGTRTLPQSTRVMPTAQATRTLPAQDAWNPAEEATRIDPNIKPALQRLAMQQPPSVIPQSDVAAARQSPASFQPAQQAMNMPNAVNAPIAMGEAPNPADVKRGAMLGRGLLPCALMAIPMAVCGMFSLWIAFSAALIIACALAAIGFNTEAQLEREGKRGGGRKGSDWLLRLVGLPWHVVKGLGMAVARTLIMLAVVALGLSIATVVLQLPYAIVDTNVLGLSIPLPTLIEGPLSESGLAQAAFCAIGWLVAVVTPGATVMRLGGGALRKPPVLRHLNEIQEQSRETGFPAN
ncbi:serine/threonine-protein kinase [Bifidobacterium ruminantium]|uniref:non-specific serine/threonine protein kinase n=1 Tax=Bifidobacterium ruminantium TaxID=78346 RepID=A0A087CT48_BIFRU|nr:serine/threonine-protein kinase [Bifidobacterium ruminantium]KFI86448.1 serine/threonine protein kinase [Bifidobacterium ruminantium]